MNMCSRWKRVSQEQMRFSSLLETRPYLANFSFLFLTSLFITNSHFFPCFPSSIFPLASTFDRVGTNLQTNKKIEKPNWKNKLHGNFFSSSKNLLVFFLSLTFHS